MSKFKGLFISILIALLMFVGFMWLGSITNLYDYFIGVLVGVGTVFMIDIVMDLI